MDTPHPGTNSTDAPMVLVVDDDTMFTTLLTMQLSALGYPSLGARSADRARALLAEKSSLRAVVCDANLPDGGLALVAELTADRPDLFTLVVSGMSPVEITELGMPAGVPTVQKPISVATLAGMLTAASVRPRRVSNLPPAGPETATQSSSERADN